MKKLLLLAFLNPVSLLFGQTVTVDDLTPGELATYTFNYTTAHSLGGNGANDKVTLLSVTSYQSAFSEVVPVTNTMDSLAAHVNIKINGVDEPVNSSNFSSIYSGIVIQGVQISLNGTGNQVAAGSEIEVEISGVFKNSLVQAPDTVKWTTNLGTGATVEAFQDVVSFGYLSIYQYSDADLDVELFPNPAQDYMTLSGFDGKQNYVIHNILGEIVMEGVTNENESINIAHLVRGTYFVKLNNYNVIQFVKKD